MLYLQTMYVYCVCPVMSECPRQMPNWLKKAETSVVLIVFIGALLYCYSFL